MNFPDDGAGFFVGNELMTTLARWERPAFAYENRDPETFLKPYEERGCLNSIKWTGWPCEF
jgi:hypothetical protein